MGIDKEVGAKQEVTLLGEMKKSLPCAGRKLMRCSQR